MYFSLELKGRGLETDFDNELRRTWDETGTNLGGYLVWYGSDMDKG